MEPDNKHHRDTWELIVGGMLALFALVVVFGAGMLVGLEKARFSAQWGANYYPNVVGIVAKPQMVLNAHGVVGPVIKIDQSSFVVEDRDGSEKTVLVTPSTTVREDGSAIKFSDLKLNDQVVAIGSPNHTGEVTATLVRVMDDGTGN
jgi:hypothetical protein